MKKIVFVMPLLLLIFFPILTVKGHAPSSSSNNTGGSLSETVLTDAMIANLGIKTVPASLEEVSKTFDLIANIDYLPEKQAIVSARFEGSVSKILVKTGQKIQKGEDVIELHPRLVGNPSVTLKAPIDGYITEQNVVLGQSVTPDQPLLRIADLSEVLVRGQAYEDSAQTGLAVGRPVIVTTASFPGEIFTGIVQRIEASFKPGTRIREIWAVIENPERKLLENMQATLSVKIGDQSVALVVPQRAVLGGMGNYFIYVRKGHHFYRRDVTLGQKFGPLREIIKGIQPDEKIVTVGNYQLQFVTSPSSADADHGHDYVH